MDNFQDQKMEELVVQLDNYSRLGIPKLHHLPVLPASPDDKVEEGRIRENRIFLSCWIYKTKMPG